MRGANATHEPPSATLVTESRPPCQLRASGAPPVTNGSTEQLKSHLARAKDNGLSEAELKEVIIHLAFYTGWPRAMSAVTVAKEVFAT